MAKLRDTFYIRIRQYPKGIPMDKFRSLVAVCVAQSAETMYLWGDVMLLSADEVKEFQHGKAK